MVRIGTYTKPSKTGVGYIMTKADNLGAYTVESEKCGVGYIFEDEEIAIVTAQGYIRMDVKSAYKLIKELTDILDDVKDLRRMGVVV